MVKIVLRADASKNMGTGHVMRCLTLARALQKCSHEPVLMINQHDISWLSEQITRSGVQTVIAQTDCLQPEIILELSPDIVVVDSYLINPVEITRLNSEVPVVSIVDGETRGVESTLYIDQNLGSERRWAGKLEGRVLAGSRYALIREEITNLPRRKGGIFLDGIPDILIFAGGTDATGIIPELLMAVDKVEQEFSMTVVTGDSSAGAALKFLHPTIFTNSTTEFDSLLGRADIVIAAAGTSSWEICTLGIPSIFLAVVNNQLQAISAIEKANCGESINLSHDRESLSSQVHQKLSLLLSSQELRATYSINCEKLFDGLGGLRVVEALESLSLKQ